MVLPNYPVSELQVTLREASRVLSLILPPRCFQQYEGVLHGQEGVLQETNLRLAAIATTKENWVTEQFKERLLSCPDPLPGSAILSALLPSSSATPWLQRAAALLWAVARLRCEPQLLEGEAPTERTQQAEVLAAARLPGEAGDHIQLYPDSLHAILLCPGGGVYPVDILSCGGGAGTPLLPLPLPEIYRQISGVVAGAKAEREQEGTHNLAYPAWAYSALPRPTWSSLRQAVLAGGGGGLEMMESSVVALALEDCPPPADLADALNAVRLGGGTCLRYYDKVVSVVVFSDGEAGLLFDHSAVDGMVAGLVADSLWRLSDSLDLQELDTGLTTSPPQPLHLSLPSLALLPPPPAPAALPILTFDLPSYPDVFSTLRAVRGAYDAWVNFSLQLALCRAYGEGGEGGMTSFLLVTPTHMRHFKHGRCDPTYSISRPAHALVSALQDSGPPQYHHLLPLFHTAFLEHKRLIKATKSGQGVGPHLGSLRRALPPGCPLLPFLELFAQPTVYLTGKDLMEGVQCAVSNVYAPEQLAVTYLGRRDRVRLVLAARGSFAPHLPTLRDSLQGAMHQLLGLALRYCLASEMGALDCLLERYRQGEEEEEEGDGKDEKKKGQGKEDRKKERPIGEARADEGAGGACSGSSEQQDFTLVVHGGAGEEPLLNPEVQGTVRFALRAALAVGAQVLVGGGSSLDAVEASVAALEDCFLFNAGRGAVLTRDGQHELEACLAEGGGRSGAVACLRGVRNPVRGARRVLEETPHALLAGEGAEHFLRGCKGAGEAGPEHFYTDLRWRELEAHRGGETTNHAQTVGAVALDRWGQLAAASSTGGLMGKVAGRVGDTAVVGAGLWAGRALAVACSGDGDAFLRQAAARRVAELYEHGGRSLRAACREALDSLGGARGGMIAVDQGGEVVMECSSKLMFVGSVAGGVLQAEVLRPRPKFQHVIWETEELVAYLDPRPWTPGATVLTCKAGEGGPVSLFELPVCQYSTLLQGARAVGELLCQGLGVQRCALVAYPRPGCPAHAQLLPLHGLAPCWEPMLAPDTMLQPLDPGYCSSRNGPRAPDADLAHIQAQIRARLPVPTPPSHVFLGDPADGRLFARLVQGEEPQWRIWEDDAHVAFLTPFPQAPGCTVLVPRRPLPSDLLRLPELEYEALALCTRQVALLLQEGLGARGCALVFEGYEVDYAHAKLYPLIAPPQLPLSPVPEFCPVYPGYVSSIDGPPTSVQELRELHARLTRCRPPRSWDSPKDHALSAPCSPWYQAVLQLQSTLFHATADFFQRRGFCYALTPLTTDTVSSPIGLGSDSQPVVVRLLGQDVFLADSMQFTLEYLLRFQDGLPGAYYVSPSFRGEDPDASHLNQFFHVECELRGDMEAAMHVAEAYLSHLTRSLLDTHHDAILRCAGTLEHVHHLLGQLGEAGGGKGGVGQGGRLPRVTLEQAAQELLSSDCLDWVEEGRPELGRKLTRRGEQALLERHGGALWVTEMDHLSVAFYQAYAGDSGHTKAKAADLLLGLGETLGLGERHATPESVREALEHHGVAPQPYQWYIDMRQLQPLVTAGWGMGAERYLCWLLQHHDVRDMQIIPRLKGNKYLP